MYNILYIADFNREGRESRTPIYGVLQISLPS